MNGYWVNQDGHSCLSKYIKIHWLDLWVYEVYEVFEVYKGCTFTHGSVKTLALIEKILQKMRRI